MPDDSEIIRIDQTSSFDDLMRVGCLKPLVRNFNDAVYQGGGLSEAVLAHPSDTLSAVFGTVNLSAYCASGKVMVTIQDQTSPAIVTFTASEKRGAAAGLQSCYGTLVEMKQLVDYVAAGLESRADMPYRGLRSSTLYLNGVTPVGMNA